MGYTFLQFQSIVQDFCKINANDTSLTNLIQSAINIALYDIARSKDWDELLTQRVTISLTGIGIAGVVNLPVDYMSISRARYQNNSPSILYPLFIRSGVIPPSVIYGKPYVYDITTGNPNQILLEPFTAIDAVNDKLYIDYYKIPTLFAADGDTAPSNMWDTEIIKRAEHYVLLYQAKPQIAQAMWATMLSQMGQNVSQPATQG